MSFLTPERGTQGTQRSASAPLRGDASPCTQLWSLFFRRPFYTSPAQKQTHREPFQWRGQRGPQASPAPSTEPVSGTSPLGGPAPSTEPVSGKTAGRPSSPRLVKMRGEVRCWDRGTGSSQVLRRGVSPRSMVPSLTHSVWAESLLCDGHRANSRDVARASQQGLCPRGEKRTING